VCRTKPVGGPESALFAKITMTNPTNESEQLPRFLSGPRVETSEAFLNSVHKKPARVGVIAPGTVERDCLGFLIGSCPNVEWTGGWDDISAALNEPLDNQPEVLVVYGLEHLPPCHESHEASKAPLIIAILKRHDVEEARGAFDRGAYSCITERDNKETLVKAIEAAIRGEPYMSDPIRTAFLKGMFVSKSRGSRHFNDSPMALSVREAEIFHHIGHGKGTSEIARELALSPKTVQAYCARVKEKRGFATLHELQIAATRQAS
jgi:DNA-binding NarL/FixJ family response regulator